MRKSFCFSTEFLSSAIFLLYSGSEKAVAKWREKGRFTQRSLVMDGVCSSIRPLQCFFKVLPSAKFFHRDAGSAALLPPGGRSKVSETLHGPSHELRLGYMYMLKLQLPKKHHKD